MRIPLRTRKKTPELTPESIIRAGLQQAYKIHPARVMPSTIIGSLKAAGFVIMSEADLDSEIALAFQAGEEEGRNQ